MRLGVIEGKYMVLFGIICGVILWFTFWALRYVVNAMGWSLDLLGKLVTTHFKNSKSTWAQL